jgi:hypothetical protein
MGRGRFDLLISAVKYPQIALAGTETWSRDEAAQEFK